MLSLRNRQLYFGGGLLFLILFFVFFLSVPDKFPLGTIITLKKGFGLTELSNYLERDGVVRSSLWFRTAAIALGGENKIQAGDYYLKKKQNAITLAWRMVHGKHDLSQIKITLPEGHTVEEIANSFDERFVMFSKEEFLSLAEQGYMFPDTYFMPINTTASSAVERFKNNFENQILNLDNQIQKSGHTKKEIITMASILEGEVMTREDKEIVSGILWKRLKLGMALQVDAERDTYKYPGLPKEPINNPGLISIEAALNPKDSPYFYFISDKTGQTHYAETLEEHIQNIQKYL